MKRTLALVLVLILTAALLTGCSPAGTYHVETIDGKKPLDFYAVFIEEMSDGQMDLNDYLKVMDLDEEALRDPIELELRKDGTFSMKFNSAGEDARTGTWKKENGAVKLMGEHKDDVLELKIDGGKLVMEAKFFGEDNSKIVFGR